MRATAGVSRLGSFAGSVRTLRHALASSCSATSLQLAVARRRLEVGEANDHALDALGLAEAGVAVSGDLLGLLGGLADLHSAAFVSFRLFDALRSSSDRHLRDGPIVIREEGPSPELVGPREAFEDALGELTRLALPEGERETWSSRRAGWTVGPSGAALTFVGSLPAHPERLFGLGGFPRAAELFLANAAVGAAGAALVALAEVPVTIRIEAGPA